MLDQIESCAPAHLGNSLLYSNSIRPRKLPAKVLIRIDLTLRTGRECGPRHQPGSVSKDDDRRIDEILADQEARPLREIQTVS